MLNKRLPTEAYLKKIMVIASLLTILCISQAYAQEELVITTYYPNPVGYYGTVKTQRMTVGRTRNPNSGLTNLIDDGVISVDNKASPPLNPAEGLMYYNNNYHAFFYYTGSGLWFPLFIRPQIVNYTVNPMVWYSGVDPGARVTPCDPPFMHVINVLTTAGVPVSPADIANPGQLPESGQMVCH
jgi:hypothetical protein